MLVIVFNFQGEGFDVMKSGDARVALIGFPSVGKVSQPFSYMFMRLVKYTNSMKTPDTRE